MIRVADIIASLGSGLGLRGGPPSAPTRGSVSARLHSSKHRFGADRTDEASAAPALVPAARQRRPGSRRCALPWRAIVVALVSSGACGCSALGFSDRVLWRVPAPAGGLVAVCQEIPEFDGPGYHVRLERPDGGLVRDLYTIGDGDPCTEVVWSPDGGRLAVLSGHVARIRFIDVAWALRNPDVRTAHWSWRQVDLSTERRRLTASGLRFVAPGRVELHVSGVRTSAGSGSAPDAATLRQVEVPLPVVTGH